MSPGTPSGPAPRNATLSTLPALRIDAERARRPLKVIARSAVVGVAALALTGRRRLETGLGALAQQQQRHVRELILDLLAHRRRHRLLALRRIP